MTRSYGSARQSDTSLDTARGKIALTRDERKSGLESTCRPITPSSRLLLAAYRGAHVDLVGKARLCAAVIVACLAVAACEKDPADAVKIVPRVPATPISVVVSPAAVTTPGSGWHPEVCPPPPEEGTGPSSLTVTGPCAFEHHGAVSCESTGDDFIVTMVRPAADGAQLMIYLNVEHYTGPGSYEDAQMFLSVQHNTFIYRWSNDSFPITVGSGEAFAVLPTTRLDAEPLLIDCTGPMTNYQCSGRGDSAIEMTTEVVSGTLRCAARHGDQP